jgi:hypothetical protein
VRAGLLVDLLLVAYGRKVSSDGLSIASPRLYETGTTWPCTV